MADNMNYVISGESVETINRVQSDRLLLNTIESERVERIEFDREVIDTLGTLGTNDFVIWKQLRRHEHILNSVIGLETFLLIALALITFKMF